MAKGERRGDLDGGERRRRAERARPGDGLARILGTVALVLGVLAALGVVGELLANLLRIGQGRGPAMALGALASLALVALLASGRRGPRAVKRQGALAARERTDGAAAQGEDPPSRRTLRLRRQLGDAAARRPSAPDERAERRRRHRRGRGGPTSNGG